MWRRFVGSRVGCFPPIPFPTVNQTLSTQLTCDSWLYDFIRKLSSIRRTIGSSFDFLSLLLGDLLDFLYCCVRRISYVLRLFRSGRFWREICLYSDILAYGISKFLIFRQPMDSSSNSISVFFGSFSIKELELANWWEMPMLVDPDLMGLVLYPVLLFGSIKAELLFILSWSCNCFLW